MSVRTSVGSIDLPSFVMTASGTAGYGKELDDYGDLSALGAVVVKSLAAFEWPGNDAPRLTAVGSDMLNSVGLAGPGVQVWRERYLPGLKSTGARVVASIWGRRVSEFSEAAQLMRGADVIALEVNVSCPNLEGRQGIFAHSPTATAEAVDAAGVAGMARWAKLSPNTPDLVEVAVAAVDAGADALVLVNTVLGLAIDVETRRPVLGNVMGGVSGPGILPVALRALYEVHEALPHVPLIGVGGVRTGVDALAMVMAGACAVQVGTASFANPRAPWRIAQEAERWLRKHDVTTLGELVGVAHG